MHPITRLRLSFEKGDSASINNVSLLYTTFVPPVIKLSGCNAVPNINLESLLKSFRQPILNFVMWRRNERTRVS
jgi:hypothetical protein